MKNLLLMLAAIRRIQLRKEELQCTKYQVAKHEYFNKNKLIMNTMTIAGMVGMFPYEQN
jgi:hypothetical protein